MKIIYKITNSLVCLAIIPVLLFLPMFRFIAVVDLDSSNQIMSIFGSLFDINQIIENAIGINFETLQEHFTIREAVELFSGNSEAFSGFDVSVIPENVINFFTAAVILFGVALVAAVIVLIIGIFTKQKTVAAVISAFGFCCVFAANTCFSHITDQLVSGKISVMSMLENLEALSSYKTYMDMVNFDIRIFELSSAYTMLLVIFGGLVLLNVGFKLADSVSDVK